MQEAVRVAAVDCQLQDAGGMLGWHLEMGLE
jgi:hypothetical protein